MLRDQRGFHTAAEVDMSLWVMREVIDAEHSRSDWLPDVVPEYEQWIQSFWTDRTLREIRVRNLTQSLFGTMSMAAFAEALLPRGLRRPKRDQIMLAGRIAGIEFEKAIMEVAGALSSEPAADRGASELMRTVRGLEVPPVTRDQWVRAVRIRNAVVHGEQVGRHEVDTLLAAMRDALEWAEGLTGREYRW